MFTQRHLVEKKLEGQENMALKYKDLKKACAMVTLRWMDVPEADVRMIEDTYEETQGGVVCGPGILEEFRVDVGMRREYPKPTVVHRSSGGDQQEHT